MPGSSFWDQRKRHHIYPRKKWCTSPGANMEEKAPTYLGWQQAGSQFQMWVLCIPGWHTGASLYKNVGRVLQCTLAARWPQSRAGGNFREQWWNVLTSDTIKAPNKSTRRLSGWETQGSNFKNVNSLPGYSCVVLYILGQYKEWSAFQPVKSPKIPVHWAV